MWKSIHLIPANWNVSANKVFLEVQAMKFSFQAYNHRGAAKILNEMS